MTETAAAETIVEPTAVDYQAAAEAASSEQDTELPEATQLPEGGDETDAADTTVGNEAAKYRRRLRDTEAKLTAVQQRLDHVHRGEVERLAAAKLADPTDVWRDGAALADLLDDDGNVDPAKVSGITDTLIQAHPHWTPREPTPPWPPRNGGFNSGSSTPESPRVDSFTKAFAPRKE